MVSCPDDIWNTDLKFSKEASHEESLSQKDDPYCLVVKGQGLKLT